jgi:hypothetical protein
LKSELNKWKLAHSEWLDEKIQKIGLGFINTDIRNRCNYNVEKEVRRWQEEDLSETVLVEERELTEDVAVVRKLVRRDKEEIEDEKSRPALKTRNTK